MSSGPRAQGKTRRRAAQEGKGGPARACRVAGVHGGVPEADPVLPGVSVGSVGPVGATAAAAARRSERPKRRRDQAPPLGRAPFRPPSLFLVPAAIPGAALADGRLRLRRLPAAGLAAAAAAVPLALPRVEPRAPE